MAPIMQLLKRDGLLAIIKKDLHNLKLMYKGHELSPHQGQHNHHRHLSPELADASRQHESVLIVDDFLTPEEIQLASAQTYKLQAERTFTDNLLIATKWKTHAEQQFIIDMPASIADRLRDVVDKHLGIDAAAATGKRGDAPKQERLPARVIYGVTEEHIDEPKDAAPGTEITQDHGQNQADGDDDPAVKAQATKEKYRQGMIGVVYLEGDGALVLGTGDAAREVPVKPGRLVVWPNTDFIHSAYGEQRRLLGPLAVIPGDRTAPLWLTVKGAGALVVLLPMAGGLVLFVFAQLIVAIVYKDETSCRPWSTVAFGIPEWLLLSSLYKILGILLPAWLSGGAGAGPYQHERERIGQFAFCNCMVQVAIIVFGAVVTYSTDIDDCTAGLYHFTSISIGMALVTMTFIFALIGKEKMAEHARLAARSIPKDMQGKWEIQVEGNGAQEQSKKALYPHQDMIVGMKGADIRVTRDGKCFGTYPNRNEAKSEYMVQYHKELKVLALYNKSGLHFVATYPNKNEIVWTRLYRDHYSQRSELSLAPGAYSKGSRNERLQLKKYTWKRDTSAMSAKEAEEAKTLLRVRELREEADMLETFALNADNTDNEDNAEVEISTMTPLAEK